MTWRPWHTLVLLSSLGWLFMYADRTIMAPVLPLIGDEWSLSQSQLGLISSVFFLAYAAVQIPVGRWSDKLGRRLLILVPGFILFGLATGALGLVQSYSLMLAASVIAGIGQGTYYPTQFALAADILPSERRGFGTALINSGQALGVSIGFIAGGYFGVQQGLGWRFPFLLFALPTVLMGIAFAFGIKEPRHKTEQPAGAANAALLQSEQPGRVKPVLWPVFLMNFFSLYGFFMILTWLPSYLQTERAYTGSATAFISSLIPWAAIPGGLLWSALSDRLGRRKPLIWMMVPVAATALMLIPVIQSHTGLMIALVVYGLFGKLAIDPILAALVADLTPKEHYGTGFGVFNFVGMASSIVAPFLTGYLADVTKSLEIGFYVSGALMLVPLLTLVWVKERGVRELPPRAGSSQPVDD